MGSASYAAVSPDQVLNWRSCGFRSQQQRQRQQRQMLPPSPSPTTTSTTTMTIPPSSQFRCRISS